MGCCCILSGLALLVVTVQILKSVGLWLYKNVIGPHIIGSQVDLARMGKWAVVTGGTDGIGKEYARELARRGMKIVLISRSAEKLKKVAEEIETESGVEVAIIDVDFKNGPEIYEKIKKRLEGLDIGVLVNNVGMAYIGFFLDKALEDPKFLQDIVSVNIHSVTHMCAIVLPRMVAKKKGVIINISSLAAKMPAPIFAIYSATKAFVDKFSVDLQTEYQDKGVIVQCILPGLVSTNMSGNGAPGLFSPTAATFVKSALKTVGITDETNGYWPHAALQSLMTWLASVTSDQFVRELLLKRMIQRAANVAKKKE